MFFWQFRGQRRPIGIFHGGTFLTAFKMRSIWCILFFNRIGPSQYIWHSPQKIQEVVPGFRSSKLSPPKLAMIWRGVRCRREYHQNDRLEKAVKKVPPWKIPIGRLCPRNCQKPHHWPQSPLLNRVFIAPILVGLTGSNYQYDVTAVTAVCPSHLFMNIIFFAPSCRCRCCV